MMKFSLLMSVYSKEQPEFFERAMSSVWHDQSVKPDEIVLVKDGPLKDELEVVVDKWKRELGDILVTIALPENVGLGKALNIGITKCSHDLVARMDTDDISCPDRFRKQLEVFEKMDVDVCSGTVREFEQEEDQVFFYRNIPEYHQDIIKYFKMRNAVNHPSVMFKKETVMRAGNYQQMIWFEDYYLWVRMVMKGAVFFNIQEPMVNMRAGAGQLSRRRGKAYARAELQFMKELKSIGFLNTYEFLRNVAIRFSARIMHRRLLRMVYKNLREPDYVHIL